MRNFKFVCLMAMAGLLLFLGGCQKDESLNHHSNKKSLKNLFKTISTWTPAEKQFFSLKDPNTTSNRSLEPVIVYNPLLILSYNHLVAENELRNFVDEISSKVGNPNWEKSAVFYNKEDKGNAVFVPLIKSGETRTNGIITFNIIEGKMVTNGYLRANIEKSLQTDNRNCFIAKHFATFDKKIFGDSPKSAFLEYLCECKNPTPIPLSHDCTWQLVKLCKDSDGGFGWEDGQIPIYPIHLDHDRDGIRNSEDQDWDEWSRRHNVTQKEFEDRIRDSWPGNFPDYDLFWQEIDEIVADQWDLYDEEDPGGASLNFDWFFNIMNFFNDLFSGIFDWFGGLFEDFWEWVDFWDDVECPDWGDVNNQQLENRTITCDWYYIKNCTGNNIYYNWWDNFDIALECDILEHMQSDVAGKLQKYLNSQTTINPCTGLPLNKQSYVGQLCDNYGYLINDQEFLEGGAITPEIELILAYDAIKHWQLSHNNDVISTSVGNTFISEMCLSRNTVNLNILEAKYIHETLKVIYPDYYNSNVNIDEFISLYGVESYSRLANEYKSYQEASIGIISWVELVEIPNSGPSSSSGFFDRTLSCESFVFYPQTGSQNGQIACVNGLYFSKEIAGAYSNTQEICVSFLLPKLRYNNVQIPPLKAADCAAAAANTAAVAAGYIYAKRALDLNFMSDEAYITLFKVTFGIKMKLSDCGYGVAADCSQCLGTTKRAVWNSGFFEWLTEELYGCYSGW